MSECEGQSPTLNDAGGSTIYCWCQYDDLMMKTAPVRDMGGSSIDEGRDDVAQGGEGQVDLCRL